MSENSYRRKVSRIVDGDTFRVHKPVQGSNSIRIAGLDAPEKGTVAGKRASNSLRGKIGGNTVTIKPVGRSYGRVVANVFSNRKKLK